jgi:hypothetical protein
MVIVEDYGLMDTNPVYKSKYYNTGYSNDKYGVCTDVVANVMLNVSDETYGCCD